ncbi:Pentatricopeptide repeat-containing protein [Thalictrum thalictroides]|uniref:Pentatricopeptide repeat-containing protein n=1 Tax=Thalictrum thalictroides TaxID=46969 RepID=A0A7J6VGN7_THATH|nr:Pentatricopeptide repeat-containing protein [Thalictrum thalictroides]
MGRKFHGKIVKSGVEFDKFVETALLCMYSECCSLDEACKVFDAMSMKDVVSWSSMILSYVRNGRVYEGLGMFRKMVFQGIEVDSVTMLSVIEACYVVCDSKLATSVHGYILKTMMRGIGSDGSLESSLIVMYSTWGDLENAERLFNQATSLNNASWTAMISCYNKRGRFQEALEIYVKMQECNVEPNSVTVVGVLVSCSRLFWLRGGMSVHGYILRSGIDLDFGTVGSALIEMYASCRKLGDCHKVFHSINDRTIVSWNSIISVSARNGLADEALGLFIQLRLHGLLPDSFTLASSLSACGKSSNYQLGSQIHGLIVKTCFDSNEYVQNSLIDMYSKCGFVDIAYKIFGEMQVKSLITWNSMVCGFTQNGNSVEAIGLLDQMHYKNLEMDSVTFLSAIQSCSHLGYLEKGKCFHHKLIINGLEKDSYVDTALTDMYAKCGDLPTAQRVFDTMLERSVVAWSAMIAGYGIHGCLDNAISLFTQMVGLGIRPNDITFMSILSACSHAGSVEQGTLYFNLMRKQYGIEPKLEHFIFMVDLLSRAGDLTGALRIINTMSVPATSSIWGALLNGCRIHGRFDMLETIRKTILDLEPNNSGYYTLLSNIYAEEGKWIEFRMMRTMMKDIGLRKVPGYSMIKINRNMYRFGAGDTTNSQSKEIFKILEDLERLAQEQGYISERRLPIRSSDKGPPRDECRFSQ